MSRDLLVKLATDKEKTESVNLEGGQREGIVVKNNLKSGKFPVGSRVVFSVWSDLNQVTINKKIYYLLDSSDIEMWWRK